MDFKKIEKEMFLGKGFKMICNECGEEMILQDEKVPDSYNENIQVSFIRNTHYFGFVCKCGNTAYVSD